MLENDTLRFSKVDDSSHGKVMLLTLSSDVVEGHSLYPCTWVIICWPSIEKHLETDGEVAQEQLNLFIGNH